MRREIKKEREVKMDEEIRIGEKENGGFWLGFAIAVVVTIGSSLWAFGGDYIQRINSRMAQRSISRKRGEE